MTDRKVRVRFAPSPTGYLHIGGARTALYNWLFAKQNNGTFILRIEDTDVERSTEDSIQAILDGLRWLGLDWDEGPTSQSENRPHHQEAARELLASGHAYKCFCTQEELEQKRLEAEKEKNSYGYDRTCRHLSAEQVAEKMAAGLPSVVRFKVPDRQGMLGYDDKVLGRIECDYREVDDFVILRSNGKPLYLLSNVVDDIRDRITHIIRGQDHMTNTIRQVLLYEALDAPLPVFAHIPLTLDTKKAKISKRSHGEIVAVHFYRDHGFIPWAFNNFLVLLGWSPGNDQEIFSKEELIQAFTLERINKSSAVFNFRRDDPKFFTDPKAIAINEHYLRTMAIAELAPMVRKELEAAGLWDDGYAGDRQQWFFHTIDLIRDRFHALKDFTSLGRAYFADDFTVDDKPLQKNVLKYPDLTTWLPALADAYERMETFDAVETERVAREMAEKLDIKPGVLINAMRTVVTGQLAGPSMFEILPVIGRDRVVRRMRDISHFFPAP